MPTSDSLSSEPFLTEALWSALLAMQRHNWEQGVASHAAIDDGRRDLAGLMATDAIARQDAHGMLGATGDGGVVNAGALGEAVALLAATDAAAAEALERQRWWLLRFSPRHDSGVVYHLADAPEVWADSIYMVVPFLAVTRDFAPADMQYRMHREHLWHETTGLYGHRFDVATGSWVRSAPWASGNGWVAAGIARALNIGGENTPAEMRGRWQRETRALIDACTPFADDGLFHDVIDDPATFTDGTAGLMLAYAVFTGVADGWLPDDYVAHADAWVTAALAATEASGLVRGVCGAPNFDRQGTSAEAQAFAIMALAARRRAG
jgi:unsaturated rhamnogalacturonyl hydrolase